MTGMSMILMRMKARLAAVRQALAENLDGVLHQQAHVGESALLDAQQAVADARHVYLGAEEVPLGRLSGHADQRVAVAEADLEGAWCVPAEEGAQVQRSPGLDAKARPHFGQRALLGFRLPPGAADEAAHGAGLVAEIGRVRHGK